MSISYPQRDIDFVLSMVIHQGILWALLSRSIFHIHVIVLTRRLAVLSQNALKKKAHNYHGSNSKLSLDTGLVLSDSNLI